VLTLCGFLLAEEHVCLKRSGFENPERARGGALGAELGPHDWGVGVPGTLHGRHQRGGLPGAEGAPLPAAGSRGAPWAPHHSSRRAVEQPWQPGVTARGILA